MGKKDELEELVSKMPAEAKLGLVGAEIFEEAFNKEIDAKISKLYDEISFGSGALKPVMWNGCSCTSVTRPDFIIRCYVSNLSREYDVPEEDMKGIVLNKIVEKAFTAFNGRRRMLDKQLSFETDYFLESMDNAFELLDHYKLRISKRTLQAIFRSDCIRNGKDTYVRKLCSHLKKRNIELPGKEAAEVAYMGLVGNLPVEDVRAAAEIASKYLPSNVE